MKKRILALALTVAMLLSMVPGQVFAAETSTVHTEHNFTPVQPQQTPQTEGTSATTQSQEVPQTEGTPEILALLDYEQAMEDLEYLSETIGPRPAGTASELLAQDYVYDVLDDLGYEVDYQEVSLDAGRQIDLGNIYLGDLTLAAALPQMDSDYTAAFGEVSGTAVYLDDPADVADLGENLEGKIVFVPGNWRSGVQPQIYSAIAALDTANAEAIVVMMDLSVYEDEVEQKLLPTLDCGDTGKTISTPVLLTGAMEAQRVPAYLATRENVQVTVNTCPKADTTSQNVIGIKRAAVETDLTIYVTAHVDSVNPSPGANDNGSGVAGMLAIARAFSQIETNYNIVFVSFCGEEIGLVGSNYFVSKLTADEKANAIGNYNLDMIATKDTTCKYMVMMSASSIDVDGGNNHTTRMTLAAAESLGYNDEHFKTVSGTPSDHFSFNNVGIPAVQYYWSSNNTSFNPNYVEKYYHTANDNMDENLDDDRLALMVNAIALAVYNDATADYAAVVGEGTAREYYTTMEAALAAAGGDASKVTNLKPHKHNNTEFATPLDGNGLKALLSGDFTSGSYYLTEDVTIDSLSQIGNYSTTREIRLCLNGKHIFGDGSWEIYKSSTFIYDCSAVKGQHHSNEIPIVHGEYHLIDATVSVKGGLMPTFSGAHFYLEGGTLIGTNTAGRGTIIGYGDNNPKYIDLISGEVVNHGSGAYCVVVSQWETLTMNGSVKLTENDGIADIYLKDNMLIHLGENFAPGEEVYTIAIPGTLPAGSYQITSGWSAAKAANGIDYIPFESSNESYDICEIDGELYISIPPHTHKDLTGVVFETPISGVMSGSFASGAYYLTGDVTLNSNFALDGRNLSGDKKVYLCLNGHNILGNKALTATYGAKLYICDCQGTGEVKLNSIYVTYDGTELYLLGGTISYSSSSGAYGQFPYCRIIVDGATLVSDPGTKADESTIYIYSQHGEIELKSGKIINHGGCGAAANIGVGYLVMNGDIELIADPGTPDIFLQTYSTEYARVITIREGFNPKGQIYSVGLEISALAPVKSISLPPDGDSMLPIWITFLLLHNIRIMRS